MWVLLALIAWPLIEIGLFVTIGGMIGLWPTLAWVLVSAAIGIAVLRHEAATGAVRLRAGLDALRGKEAVAEAGRGMFRTLAGLLLVLPGFMTDAIGLLLLLPPLQAALAARMTRRVRIVETGMRSETRQADVIEGEWEEVPPAANQRRRPSGWTED